MIHNAIVKTNNLITKINNFDQTNAGAFVAGVGMIAIFASIVYFVTLYMVYKYR